MNSDTICASGVAVDYHKSLQDMIATPGNRRRLNLSLRMERSTLTSNASNLSSLSVPSRGSTAAAACRA
jgi:hypothetical protein